MLRIRKLDLFIARQFLLLFVGTFFICQFVLMMQFLWRYVDNLIGKGLSMEVLAQFFWYMGLMLVPQALPLAILLSSLITFGNLGESSELTALKASGISLMQTFRSLIVIAVIIMIGSFYFQNVTAPNAYSSFRRILISMKQKSPELEIPEGVFYDGIPGTNLYVEHKDMSTGMLYGITVYRIKGSFEDVAIILADSGMLQATAEKEHLLFTLYSGEWFENMKAQDLAGSASIPYRRETFSKRVMLLDFDSNFNMADMAGVSSSAQSKGMSQIYHDLDSIRSFNDSVAHAYYNDAKNTTFRLPEVSESDSILLAKELESDTINVDTFYNRLSDEQKQNAVRNATNALRMRVSEMEMKGNYSSELNKTERRHRIEAINKITLSLSCIIFFFIGAPLGAIIRKGGLGTPVVISVIVFIIYYIFDNSGMRMARDDLWTVWFGKWLSTAVLAPVAAFFTYKANNDSVVFNADTYKNAIRIVLGLRISRNIGQKEVIINDPNYKTNAIALENINRRISQYSLQNNLSKLPNPIDAFFRLKEDTEVQEISNELEKVIEDLSNTCDRVILSEINKYPILAVRAHVQPFKLKWLNALVCVIIPIGLFFYLRMCRFRRRLANDLKVISNINNAIRERIMSFSENKMKVKG